MMSRKGGNVGGSRVPSQQDYKFLINAIKQFQSILFCMSAKAMQNTDTDTDYFKKFNNEGLPPTKQQKSLMSFLILVKL